MILNVHLCVKILFFYRLKFILFELNKETPMNIEIPLKMMIERAIYARISLLLFCIVMKFRILYRLLHNEYIYIYIYLYIHSELSIVRFQRHHFFPVNLNGNTRLEHINFCFDTHHFIPLYREKEMHLCIPFNGLCTRSGEKAGPPASQFLSLSLSLSLSRSDTVEPVYKTGKEQRDRKAGRENFNFGGVSLIFPRRTSSDRGHSIT